MRISIFVYGSWGDIRPHVVLGMELKKAGHEVQVIASKGYEEWVRERNLEFFPLSTDVNTYAKENASLMDENIIKQLQLARKAIQPIFTEMGLEVLEATRDSDIIMTVEFGVSLIFDVVHINNLKPIFLNPAHLNPTREISCVAMPPAPSWFPFPQWYNWMTYSMIRRIQWSLVSGPRNNIAKQLRLPKSKFKDFCDLVDNAPALTIVSPHVLQRPSDWADHFQVTGYLIDDDTEWAAPTDLVNFIADGDPPIYIGFGSMPDSKPDQTTKMLIEAVQRAEKRAIILKGWAGFGTDTVPDNIYILKYAPHEWLFPQMSAIVHHGGAGTTASAFKAGVPMIVVPHNADQPYWGRRSHELGVGTEPIPRKKLNSGNLSQVIRLATSDTVMQNNALKLGEQIQQEDGLATTLEWFSKFME